MSNVLKRLFVFVFFVILVFLCLNQVEKYVVTNLVPSIITAYSSKTVSCKEIRSDGASFTFPLGISIKNFSVDILLAPQAYEQKQVIFSGDQIGLSFSPVQSIFEKKILFDIFVTGGVIHSDIEDISLLQQYRGEDTTDLSQIIIRKVRIPFSCSLSHFTISNLSKSFVTCFQQLHKDTAIPLQEVFYDFHLDGQKRLLTISEVKNTQAVLNENSLMELNSLFRNQIDDSHVALFSRYPIYSLQFFVLKKIAEEKTRVLDMHERKMRLNYGAAYFYFLLSEYYGAGFVDELIQLYKSKGGPGLGDNLSTALLGKLSSEKNVSHDEFLTPGFLDTYILSPN